MMKETKHNIAYPRKPFSRFSFEETERHCGFLKPRKRPLNPRTNKKKKNQGSLSLSQNLNGVAFCFVGPDLVGR